MVSSGSRCEVWQVRVFRLRWLQVAITPCVRLLLMAALAKLIDRRSLSCAPMRAALCADAVLESHCQRSAARVRIYADRTAVPHCSSALERSIGFVDLSCGHTRASPPSQMCIAHPRWRHSCSPSPQVVDEALWMRHSKRRVRDAPRPLYADGTQAQHTTYGLLALPRSLESGVCQGKDAAAFVRSDASCVSLDLVMCVRMLTGLDAPWDMARHSASARSSSYFLFVVRSSEKEYKYFE